ncbi:hypothetical protein ACFYV7_39485 [Nocardia suismassiliense]|uniref:Uncharacterized protein n=1 Tax=Nocardia suismassiliense TaxID=2077092 RepID=A0ABW6R5X1_9NOCA
MTSRLSTFLVAGCSILLIGGAAPAHAGPGDGKKPAEKSQEAETKAGADPEQWVNILEQFCEGAKEPGSEDPEPDKSYSAEGLQEFDKVMKLSPLDFGQNEHPVDAARDETMTEKDGTKAKDDTVAGTLLKWRSLMCGAADFAGDFGAAKRKYEEKYGKKMKPGCEGEDGLVPFFEKKAVLLEKAIKREQKKQDPDADLTWGKISDPEEIDKDFTADIGELQKGCPTGAG